MMMRKVTLAIFSAIVVGLTLGLVAFAPPKETGGPVISIASITVDKESYRPYEPAELTVLLESSGAISDVIVRVRGIQHPYKGTYWITWLENERYDPSADTAKFQKRIDFEEPGTKEVKFDFEMPCPPGCKGFRYGPYEIQAEVYSGDRIVDARTISIQFVEALAGPFFGAEVV